LSIKKTIEFKSNTIKSDENIAIQVLSIDTVMYQKSWTFAIDLDITLHPIQNNSNEAYMIDVLHNQFKYSKYLYADIKRNTIHPDYDIFCIKNKHRNLRVHIPINALNLSGGNQLISFSLVVNKVYLEKDPNSSILKHHVYDETPFLTQSIDFNITLPHLIKNTITLSNINIQPNNKSKKFDFTLNNQGLPDLYWQVWVGNDLKYFSPTYKNSFQIEKPITSDTISYYSNDLISIYILDFDNGPFNQDDLIYQWIGNNKSLLTSTHLSNDLLKECEMSVKKIQ
jgi:hypothetical protein